MRRLARTSVVTRSSWLLALTLSASCGGAASAPAHPSDASDALVWGEWGSDAFERARHEDKPILLSVQASWCHWCHVMNETTYRDPEVVRRLDEDFVVIRADADARPDLAERYARYGWPATVFLTPDGAQILGLRGHRTAARLRAILERVRAAHAEGRTLDDAALDDTTLDDATGADEGPAEDLAELRALALSQLDSSYDEELGGWGRRQRYPLAAPVEHAFYRAALRGEARWRERAYVTLERYVSLIDPVFGGMYQYSEPNVWDRPHFEKIVPVQAGAIRAFAEAYRASGDRRWLDHADAIHRYVREFLRAPDGAFYASQDADLDSPRVPGRAYYALDAAARRQLGMPRVDTHVYAAQNGMLIEALAALHVASEELAPLAEATRAAERILRTHRRDNGLLAHDALSDDPVLYLHDQAYFLSALVALHQATGQGRWLDEAARLADAMVEHLVGEDGGFVAHTPDPRAEGFFAAPRVPITDNAVAARTFAQIARLRDEPTYREVALRALRAAGRADALRRQGRMVGELLLALEALRDGLVILSVVGPDEPRTAALHRAALRFYDPACLVELGRPGASRYPYPDEPAVFLCTNESCSMPIFDPDELPTSLASFLGR